MLLSALCATAIPAARAAPDHLKLNAAQIGRLAIRTAAPQPAEHGRLSDLPARTVVPPQQSHVVSAPLAGIVTQVTVAPGQSVRRGDVLFQLSSPALAELRKGASQAQIHLQLAERNARRDQQLLDEGLIAESRHRASQATLAEARVAHAERREALRLAGAAADGSSTVAIRAPIEGIVLELMVSPSARVESAAALARVAAIDPLWLEIQVPLRDAARIAPDAPVTLRDSALTARIVASAGQIAAESQSVVLRAALPNPARTVRPGQFFSVSVPVTAATAGAAAPSAPAANAGAASASGAASPAGRLWQVPAGALARLDEKTVVFVRDADGFRIVPVQVREAGGELTVISADLAVDAAIVVSGATSLKAVASGIGAAPGP